jgi:hypothetical protein
MDWLDPLVIGLCGAAGALVAQALAGAPCKVVAGKKEYNFNFFGLMALVLFLLMGLAETFVIPQLQTWLR